MAKPDQKIATLGEKLSSLEPPHCSKMPFILLLSVAIGLLSAFAANNPIIGFAAFFLCAAILALLAARIRSRQHLLIRFDRHGFMSGLKLSKKTAVFDGSNIYHFGLDNKIGPVPLGALVSALRSEGYRIVCFFDANIYHTLHENRAFQKDSQGFSIRILQNIFELKPDEIYIVPTGYQADGFVIESLAHLPISFAVTNDRFRDYEKAYEFLAADNQWRKGVEIQGRQLNLYQHKFKNPLVVKE